MATAEDIDTACKLGSGTRWARWATLDLTGIDIMRNASDNIYNDTRDGKFAPPELLSRMVWPATWAARPARASTRY